jgi:predicted CXXCH cytochrome family protein
MRKIKGVRCALAAVAGGWLSLGLFSGSAAGAFIIAAPKDGAIVGKDTVTLSGREDAGAPSIDVTVNGREIGAVPVKSGVFIVSLSLSPGFNRVSLHSPTSLKELVFEYRTGGEKGTYLFHAPYEEGDCGACHPKGRPGAVSRVSRSHSDFCHSCHDRKDTARFLHGPVGAGQCIFCHDPHGSSYQAFVTAPESRLCLGCHDQPSSRSHLKAAPDRGCEECHNAHGSSKKFFLH